MFSPDPAILVVFLLVNGIIMLMICLIGEYIGKFTSPWYGIRQALDNGGIQHQIYGDPVEKKNEVVK